MTNAHLEARVAALEAALDTFVEILKQVFDHRDMPIEVRKKFYELTRPARPVESAEPLPPEVGEAQRDLNIIIAMEKFFGGK